MWTSFFIALAHAKKRGSGWLLNYCSYPYSIHKYINSSVKGFIHYTYIVISFMHQILMLKWYWYIPDSLSAIVVHYSLVSMLTSMFWSSLNTLRQIEFYVCKLSSLNVPMRPSASSHELVGPLAVAGGAIRCWRALVEGLLN